MARGATAAAAEAEREPRTAQTEASEAIDLEDFLTALEGLPDLSQMDPDTTEWANTVSRLSRSNLGTNFLAETLTTAYADYDESDAHERAEALADQLAKSGAGRAALTALIEEEVRDHEGPSDGTSGAAAVRALRNCKEAVDETTLGLIAVHQYDTHNAVGKVEVLDDADFGGEGETIMGQLPSGTWYVVGAWDGGAYRQLYATEQHARADTFDNWAENHRDRVEWYRQQQGW